MALTNTSNPSSTGEAEVDEDADAADEDVEEAVDEDADAADEDVEDEAEEFEEAEETRGEGVGDVFLSIGG